MAVWGACSTFLSDTIPPSAGPGGVVPLKKMTHGDEDCSTELLTPERDDVDESNEYQMCTSSDISGK
jgi:hypothetical protein